MAKTKSETEPTGERPQAARGDEAGQAPPSWLDQWPVGEMCAAVRACGALTEGFANAVRDGMEGYTESMRSCPPSGMIVDGRFVVGTLAGYTRFFATMADATARAMEDARSTGARASSAAGATEPPR